MQRNFDRGMLAVIGLLVALIAVNAVIAYYNIVDLYQARVRVGTSRQVQASLKDLLSSVKDAETGLRGYVITGDESHLKHYFEARRSVDGFVKRVHDMTRDNPAQQDRLPILRQRIEERLLELNYTLDVMRAKGFGPAREIMLTDWGKITMDALRAEIDHMLAEETRVLDARNTVSLQGMSIAHATSVFAALLGLLMLGALVWQMRRNFIARDRSEAVLSDQRELFRTTLASLLEAVVTTDVDGRITYMNASAAALTGWPVTEAVGKPVGEVVRVVDDRLHQPVENSAQRALREVRDVPVAQRFQLLARSGEGGVPIDDSAAPIRDPQGRITGAVLVFRDISQRKRSQDALLDADRRKDEFLAVLAHELRNPLAPLRNALQIVRMANHDPATVRQVWGMMERQIDQMVRLIDDLLDVSRITRGKLQLRKEPVEIASVVEAALEMSAPMLERAKHAIEVSMPDGRYVVEGDRARLVQAIDNLITNAAKYTDSGGRILLAVESDEGVLRIRVKDNGIGIPKEMLERVFEMFTQVDRSLERSRGGLGIGLTLVRRIVELHGGTVVACSEGAGRGSEFTITLPLAGSDAGLRPVPPPAARSTASHRILVVDDNQDAASSLMETLQLMGHEVHAAFDGLECLREAERFLPEMVFLDIGMPRLNGFDTAKRLRGEPWGRHCLLVAVTGWGQDEDRRRAREAGFDHHLVKPIDFDALGAIIATFSARKRPAILLEKAPHASP
jgi:PAS domain S-box-containing protein